MAKFKPISESAFSRMMDHAERDPTPFATAVSYVRRLDAIQLTISTNDVEATILLGRNHIAGLRDIEKASLLKEASVEGAGSIIAFPRADVFLSVGPLLEQFFGPMEWGRRDRRAAASRENGKRGGRPRKQAANERVLEDSHA